MIGILKKVMRGVSKYQSRLVYAGVKKSEMKFFIYK
jgi:hypothetical protein